jgi:carbamoyl-phosphate synthase large subunit
VLVDQYLRDAIECDVDVVSDGSEVRIAGVMQHIEEAGVHSGDSACTIPPYSLPDEIIAEMERQAVALAKALQVRGLMNDQIAVKDSEVYLIEVIPRASRTVPFVAKAIGRPVAKIAARVMAGEPLSNFAPFDIRPKHMAVKEAVFPFARFPGSDPVLMGAGMHPPHGGTLFVSVKDGDKQAIVPAVKTLLDHGFAVIATGGTQQFLADQGLDVTRVNKVAEGRPHIVDAIVDGEVQLIFNTTEGWQSLMDSQSIRASALEKKLPYYTTAAACVAVAQAIVTVEPSQLEVRSLQDYYS